MAVSVTGWPQSVEYRAVLQDSLTSTAVSNATGTPCTITSIVFDNTGGSAANYLKVVNDYTATPGQTEPHIKIRATSGQKMVIDLPKGIPLDKGLTFWGTANASNADTTTPAVSANQTVKVTFVISTDMRSY